MDEIQVEQILAWVSWALAAVSNFRYNFGRRSPWDHGHQDDVAFTPFTSNYPMILIYWIAVVALQGVYLAKYYSRASRQLTWHFVVNNALLLGWSYLFARGHYFWSEVLILLSVFNLLCAYIIGRSYRISPFDDWVALHVPIVVLPLTWALYVFFWNGAALLHARNIMSRLLANILIWDFLVIPAFFIVAFGDYAIGFANAYISVALGLGQLFTKVFALQWIFAFVIAFVLALLSLGAYVNGRRIIVRSGENAPLINEHA